MTQPGSRASLVIQTELWSPPQNANPYNDEFNTNAINAAWTVRNISAPAAGSFSGGVDSYDTAFNAGNVVRAVINGAARPSWLMMQPPASGDVFLVSKPVVFPANFLAIARCKFNVRVPTNPLNNDSGIGMLFCEDAAGLPDRLNSIEMVLNEQDIASVAVQSQQFLAGAATGVVPTANADDRGQPFEYIAIHKVGNDYYTWVGTAGGNWSFLNKYTQAFTMAHFALYLINVDTQLPGVSIVGVDFVRFYETDTFLF